MTLSRFLICLLATFSAVPLYSQYDRTVVIDVRTTFFTTDYQGNLYYTDHDSLVKLVPPYHHFYSFRFSGNTMPDLIDVSNPAQPVCLFRNQQQVIVLDSALKPVLRPFYLDELGMYDIFSIVSTGDMSLWFYNIYTNSLVKLSKNFIPEVRNVDLNPYFTSPRLPSFFTAYQNDLYIDVPSTGILVLNKEGGFKTAFNVEGIPDFQVLDHAIYYYRDNLLMEMNMTSLKTRAIQLPPEPGVINAHYHPDFLILQTLNHIIVYRRQKGS